MPYAPNLLMVECETLKERPMSAKASPLARRANASAAWCAVSLGFRPNLTPRACARTRPSQPERFGVPSLQSHGPYNNSAHLEPFSLFSVAPRY